MYCTKCKKNCPSHFFANDLQISTFTTCIDCRTLDHTRRFPPLFPITDTNLNTMNPLGQWRYRRSLKFANYSVGIEEDIYDASDNENTNIDDTSRVHGDVDVVGEEAVGNDEPVIFISHTDTREYENHMRARDTLPENHDDVLNNVQELNHGKGLFKFKSEKIS